MVEPISGGKTDSMGADLSSKAQNPRSGSVSSTEVSQNSIALDLPAVSPRMRADPLAGILITEYLSDDGQIEQQYPSEVTVAYLRSGLMEDGSSKADENSPTRENTLV